MVPVDKQWVNRARVGAGGGEPSDVSRSCYEFALVLSNLHEVEAQAGGRGSGARADQDVEGLWRKRVEAAEDIVNAAAPTIHSVILKVAMTRFLLSESALLVGLTAQCLEECDRALSPDDGCEQNLVEQEPELWRLRKDVQEKVAELEHAVRDQIDNSEDEGGVNDASPEAIAFAWNQLHDSVRTVTRYETRTAAGLRAKGQLFRNLLPLLDAMGGVAALRASYFRDFEHLAYRRLHGENSRAPRRLIG